MHTDIINHFDILESNKPNQYSLGKTLIIGEEMFEDLNEIIANYISSQWRNLLAHKNYRDTGGDREKIEQFIFYVTACGSTKTRFRHEYITASVWLV